MFLLALAIMEELHRIVKARLGHDILFGYPHALRVMENAEHIAERVEVNKNIVRIASLLHDIAFDGKNVVSHAEESAIAADKILKELGIPSDKRIAIMNTIRKHDFRVWEREGEPKTNEEKVVSDAENIERCSPQGLVKFIIIASKLPTYKDSGDIIRAASKFINKAYASLFFEVSKERAKESFEASKGFLEMLVHNVS